jgi:DNA-directed RNA polymerase subunit RPC12/RpoP
MNCPKCNIKLTEVDVFSQCLQKATLDSDGNIKEYSEVKSILDTLGIECPNCSCDLSSIITES